MKHLLVILFFINQALASQEINIDKKPIIPSEPKKLDSSVLKRINSDAHHFNFQLKLPEIMSATTDSVFLQKAEKERLDKLLGTYEQFMLKLLALKIPETPKIDLKELNPYYIYPAHGEVGVTLGGPISFFYSRFSKEEKSLRKFNELQAYKPKQDVINKKYNIQKVHAWTGLTGEKLTKFVLFCHFENNYLLYVNEYDLIKNVFEKLDIFLAMEDTAKQKPIPVTDTSKNIN